MVREIPLARHAWELLKPLEANADTINVERHLSTNFHLAPPKCDATIPHRPSYSYIANAVNPLSPVSPETETFTQSHFRPVFTSGSNSPDPPRAIPQPLPSPGYRQRVDTAQTDVSRSDNPSIVDDVVEAPLPLFSTTSLPTTINEPPPPLSRQQTSTSVVSFDPVPLSRKKTLLSSSKEVEKTKSRWRSRLTGSKKENFTPSIDSSSLSSNTLESQRLEEVPLKSLIHSQKMSSRGRGAKNVNVYLSQNSCYALFWTQPVIHLWDIGTSPPTLKREFSTDGNCVLAAVTQMYLAYIVGTRDQKLTVRTRPFTSQLHIANISLVTHCQFITAIDTDSGISYAIFTMV